jgi:hypothetical protein
MDGISGLAGWKWIFILEGLAPIGVSLILYFLLPDRPETASCLTPRERQFVVNRIALRGGGRATNDDKIGMSHIKAGFSDWRVWPAIIPFWGCAIGTYESTATVLTVVQGHGLFISTCTAYDGTNLRSGATRHGCGCLLV